LEIWNTYRTEIWLSGLIGKEAGGELPQLQAMYARACTVLRNHTQLLAFLIGATKRKDVIPKMRRIPSPTNSAFEPCPTREGPIFRPVGRTQDIRGTYLSTKGEFHEQYRTHDPCFSHGSGNRSWVCRPVVLTVRVGK
jgi:hypothetical protein